MSAKSKIGLAVLIILLAAASRQIKHPFNFTPIIAMSIFAGCYLRNRWGILVPLSAMLISDIFLYSTEYGWSMFSWKITLAVYAAMGLTFFTGWAIKNHKKWYFILSGALVSSISFFIITNFAVWIFFNWYPHTLDGLARCFTLALPFFRNSLAGDIVYTGFFFGAYELALHALKLKEQRSIPDSIS